MSSPPTQDSVPLWPDTQQVESLTGLDVWHYRGRVVNVVGTELTGGTSNADGLYYSNGFVWFSIISGVSGWAIRNITTATDTITSADEILQVDYTATGAVSITLPPANAFGKCKRIKDTGLNCATNNITITPNTGLIEGEPNVILAIDGMEMGFYSDGTNIFMI